MLSDNDADTLRLSQLAQDPPPSGYGNDEWCYRSWRVNGGQFATFNNHHAVNLNRCGWCNRCGMKANNHKCSKKPVAARPVIVISSPQCHGSVSFVPPCWPKRPTLSVYQTNRNGSKGEEIHTDEQGRIKVQFHWDRAGQGDEKTSLLAAVSPKLGRRSLWQPLDTACRARSCRQFRAWQP